MEILATADGLAVLGGGEVSVLDLPYRNITDLLSDPEGTGRLSSARVRSRAEVACVSDLAIAPFSKVTTNMYGVGMNYHSKSTLTGRPAPSSPLFFLKPANAIGRAGSDVVIPGDVTVEADYEAEVGIVIGREAWQVDEAQAGQVIAGIVAVNDMTARDIMRATSNPLLGKCFPGFSPIGSTMRVGGLDQFDECITVRSWVNGGIRQDSDSMDMIFTITDLIARLSRHVRLIPGDILITGTPAGTGQDLDCYLESGDEVVIQIADLAPLSNRVLISGAATSPKD